MNIRATSRSRATLLIATLSALALSTVWLVSPAFGTKPDPLHTVTICHRTNSVTNPYVQITVDEASVDGNAGNDNGQGDHLLDHLGPVFDVNNPPPPPHNGDQWGDIIPPFYSDGSTPTGYPSLNWDAAGQAIFENGCNFPGESVEQSVAESAAESAGQSAGESAGQSAGESAGQSAGESAGQSAGESAGQSDGQSAGESAGQSGEQTVEAGTGTPGESNPDTAGVFGGGSPIPTILFSLILLGSLASLAVINVKGARARS